MPKISLKDEKAGITRVKNMRDYSNDPFFKKKKEMGLALLEKQGLPESFKKKSRPSGRDS